MSLDTGPSLRTVLCLTNPSGLQAARWGSLDTGPSLRTPILFKYAYQPNNTH